MVGALSRARYVLMAELEVAGLPAAVFLQVDTGEYVVVVTDGEKACIAGAGRYFRMVRERGA